MYPTDYRKGSEYQYFVYLTMVILPMGKQSIYPLVVSKNEILNEEKQQNRNFNVLKSLVGTDTLQKILGKEDTSLFKEKHG